MSRKQYNLAKAKWALYEKWHRLMQHSAGKPTAVEPGQTAVPSAKHRKAVYKTNKYYAQMLQNYHKINLALNEENLKIKEYLDSCDPRARTVYIMTTGFGKGISFGDSQIAHILRISVSEVRELFNLVRAGAQVVPHPPLSSSAMSSRISRNLHRN